MPDLSGLYFVKIAEGGTSLVGKHDIYNTEEKKIPNPTIRTAIVGE